MSTPNLVRAWERRFNDAVASKLRAQLSQANHRIKLLEQQVADLQAANEGHYRAQYDATGGPRLDPAQPFPSHPSQPAAGWGLKGSGS
ncbi:hypothetical protein ACF06P_35735 [Streptomyces sp. NPDC015684]|uniref:hypothetical protein n=1 Tax=Streptomyces sp. NPDC015684 TaxID=3364963 RepID=UPI0036F583DF